MKRVLSKSDLLYAIKRGHLRGMYELKYGFFSVTLFFPGNQFV